MLKAVEDALNSFEQKSNDKYYDIFSYSPLFFIYI
jgi:hypothetical protein